MAQEEKRVWLAREVSRELMDQPDLVDLQDLLVRKEIREKEGLRETPVNLENLESRVKWVQTVEMELQEGTVGQDLLDRLAQMERTETQDLREYKDYQVYRDCRDFREQREKVEEKATKDHPVPLDHLERLEKTEDPDPPDLLDLRDLEVNEEQLVSEEDKGLRVYQEVQASLARLDGRVIKVRLGQRDRLASQDHRVRQEPRVIEAQLDFAVFLERGVQLAQREMLERRANPATVEKLEIRVHRELLDFLEIVDHLDCLGQKENRANLDQEVKEEILVKTEIRARTVHLGCQDRLV